MIGILFNSLKVPTHCSGGGGGSGDSSGASDGSVKMSLGKITAIIDTKEFYGHRCSVCVRGEG